MATPPDRGFPRPPEDAQDIVELSCRIRADCAEATLLEHLAARFRYHSPERWREEFAAGRVFLEGRRATGDERPRRGMRLVYHKVHPEPPVDRSVDVLYRDDSLAVVAKPAHLPVHADGPFVRHTLIHLLRTEHDLPNASLVHRLDRETSGLCIVARTPKARSHLEKQFADGRVAKEYLAVVEGQPPERFEVDLPIGHSPDSRIALRRAAGADSLRPKSARTRFAVERRGPERALVRCLPETGRTHQIRVHLEAVGHPIVGDKLYGHDDEHYLAFVRAVKAGADPRAGTDEAPSRQLLHAAVLRFAHPGDDRPLRFASAPPDAFARWLARDS